MKSLDSAGREDTPPRASAAEPSSLIASRPPLSREQLEASLNSCSSPAASLSDDSWVYVSPDSRLRLIRPGLLPALGERRHERGDDTWLLPSVEVGGGQFPLDAGQDVRGSAAVDHQTFPGGEADPNVNITGHYENDGRENFQRFAVDEPSVQVSSLPNSRVTSPSSDSSSESDTSDERGDEGSDERSDVSRSVSDAGSQSQKRQSRLSRFFRSLVMSDTDSYDEDDDQAYMGAGSNSFQRPQQHQGHREEHLQQGVMASAQAPLGERVVNTRSASSGPEASYFENEATPPLPACGESGIEAHSRVTALSSEASVNDTQGDKTRLCDSNHNSMAEVGVGQRSLRVAACDAGSGAVPSGAAGGRARATTSTGRGRAAIEDSDDSDVEYEPQTSMLRPKRKPRSRLKKFFTSLLSLSSSDDDDEEIEGQVAPATSMSDRH